MEKKTVKYIFFKYFITIDSCSWSENDWPDENCCRFMVSKQSFFFCTSFFCSSCPNWVSHCSPKNRRLISIVDHAHSALFGLVCSAWFVNCISSQFNLVFNRRILHVTFPRFFAGCNETERSAEVKSTTPPWCQCWSFFFFLCLIVNEKEHAH